jgi:cobaltochelatase CobS
MRDHTSSMEDVWSRIDGLSEAIASMAPKVTNVHLANGTTIKLDGVQHAKFGEVLKCVAERVPTYLVGPAGTGKSTIGENAAKALGLDFYSMSCSAQMTKTDLVGFMNANGGYTAGLMRAPFENGGVFVLDEVDNSNPNLLSTLNTALSNGHMSFPDGPVKRHPDFVVIATANTTGHGATMEYVGRQALDMAFLDRFAYVEVGYDEAVEDAMLASVGDLDPATARSWVVTVRKARENVAKAGLRHIVSPRATLNGARLLRQGADRSTVIRATIMNGILPDSDQGRKILDGITL